MDNHKGTGTVHEGIWQLIAEHVDPNPVHFVRLASVSRTLFRVFTQDKIWKPLDVYGIKHGIYRRFIEDSSQSDLEVMSSVWCYPLNPDTYTKHDVFANLYLYLGYLVNTCVPETTRTITSKNLALCALGLDEYCYFIDHFSAELLQDKDLAMAAVSNRGCALENFTHFSGDREIVLRAVETGCPDEDRPLQFANQDLQDDDEVVLAAVKQNGYSLEFASDRLRSDRSIVYAAVERDGPSIEYAVDPGRDLVLKSVQASPYSLALIPPEYQDDDEIVLSSIKTGWESISDAPPRFCEDPTIVRKLLAWHPDAMEQIQKFKDRMPEYKTMWQIIQQQSGKCESP